MTTKPCSGARAGHVRRLAPAAFTLALVCTLLAAAAPSASAAIAFRSKSTASINAKSLSISAPAGAVAGDVEIASIAVSNTNGISAPSGWTSIRNTTSSTNLDQAVYYHVVGASEPTSYGWGATSKGNVVAGISDYTGVDNTSPVDASATASGTSGNAGASSVTTTHPLDFVAIAASFSSSTSVSATADASTTERWNVAFGTIGGDEADSTAGAAGATATKTVTPSGSDDGWVAQTVALTPAAGSLSLTAPSSQSFSSQLSAQAQTVPYTVGLTVDDETASASGWNLTITSTQFTTGGASPQTLATTASSLTGATSACSGTCVSATNGVSYPVAVPAAPSPPTAVKFFDAAAGTGSGPLSVTPTISVSLPTTTRVGTYSSTLTFTLATGP